MDELTGLLAELEAPPDAVWMRVVANALDTAATHQDLADLVPDAEDDADLPAESFADDLGEDDPDSDPYLWLEDLEVPAGSLDDRSADEPDAPHHDDDQPDQNPDVS